jgi:ferredoxin, 2Fe-2S
MTILNVTNRGGDQSEIEAEMQRTLMENLRDQGFDDILATCGGACSCGTCHVYVGNMDGALSPISEDEEALLDSLTHRRPESRLSCQILVTEKIQRISLKIAPPEAF